MAAGKYGILSLDGGGIRGILTARLLERITDERPAFLDRVELFAGTSTGAILALGLAMGIAPARLVALYREQGPVIFADTTWDDTHDLWGLNGAQYRTHNRLRGLYPTFGDRMFDDIPRRVLIPTFLLDSANPITPSGDDCRQRTWKPKFFRNFACPEGEGRHRAIDVIMRSSAAPTYFPIYQGYADGGVVANNPSMCALAQALNPDTGGQALTEIALASLSTGCKLEYIDSFEGDWGYRQWGKRLVSLLFESGSGLADYQCRQLLGKRYLRLDPDLHEAVGLDSVKRMDFLVTRADEFFDTERAAVLSWVDDEWLS